MPLARLTTIVMPYKSGKLKLRSSNKNRTHTSKTTDPAAVDDKQPSEFHRMTAIQILKYGLSSRLHKKPGWLAKLLIAEGSVLYMFCDISVDF